MRTLLAGQVYQGQSLWDVKAFEYIAARACDALADLVETLSGFGQETVYIPVGARIKVDETVPDTATPAPRAMAH